MKILAIINPMFYYYFIGLGDIYNLFFRILLEPTKCATILLNG